MLFVLSCLFLVLFSFFASYQNVKMGNWNSLSVWVVCFILWGYLFVRELVKVL